MVGKHQKKNQSQTDVKYQLFHLLKTLTRNRIIWTHYQILVKVLTTLPVTRRMKMKGFLLI